MPRAFSRRSRSPQFDPTLNLAAKLIEQIELDALNLHVDTRTLGVAVAKHLATWFEALPNAARGRALRRPAPVGRVGRRESRRPTC